jgi:uncharacterized protein YdhG (YjbR/CyaY superfamily)
MAKEPNDDGFSPDERAAMRERVRELKRAASNEDREKDVLAKIAEMPPHDRAIAKRLHDLVKSVAPGLTARTWYGMPAYAKDGQVLCFFQAADEFKASYATLGFSDKAGLDEGDLWPTGFALKELTDEVEHKIAALLRKAVG